LDKQLNYVSANSGVVQVIAGSSKQALVAPVQNISKNGYLYIYVSNESPQNLYFDNVTVKQITGPLQQEQSYYPHGLPMAGISDKQLLKQITPYKANGGVELEEDYGLQTYNTDFRKYDPQIGRFNGVDALAELTGDLTPYQFGANDPVFWNDPSGLSLAAPARPNQGSATSISTPGITPTAFPTGSGSYSLPFSSGDPDESGGDNYESSSGGGGESNSGGDESASGGGFVNSGIGFSVGYWGDGGGGESGGGNANVIPAGNSTFSPFKNKSLPIGMELFGFPILPVYEEEMPITFYNILKAITIDGQPSILTYIKGIGKGNRKDLFKDPNYQNMGQDMLNWRDEYPFASTLEGGPGARVILAPAEEQLMQMHQLRMFYRQYFPSGNGKFLVFPVKKDRTPGRQKAPVFSMPPGLLEKLFERFLPPILIPEGMDFGPQRVIPGQSFA
jgi:RHS repeat-associated protein